MNREQKKARGQAAMHRAQELAKNGQFRLRSVLSRTAIVADFVFDGAPPLTEGIVRLRNRAEAMSRFARMTLAISAGAAKVLYTCAPCGKGIAPCSGDPVVSSNTLGWGNRYPLCAFCGRGDS